MPERNPTVKPMIIAGTNVKSGTPNTAQLLYTQGGSETFTILSGIAGGHGTICVGAGRLDAGFVHDSTLLALSGQPITFFDTASPGSGGFSGMKVLGVLAPSDAFATTGISGAAWRGGQVRQFGFPFTSGLSYTGWSGQPGWSVTYSQVVSG